MQFVSWVDSNDNSGKHAVVIAYDGETCDLKWIWRLTQVPGSPYVMPQKLKYFIDPLRAAKNYKGCKLNPAKIKWDSLELGSVWKFINDGSNLNGARNSSVDVKADTDVLLYLHFVQYTDRNISIH